MAGMVAVVEYTRNVFGPFAIVPGFTPKYTQLDHVDLPVALLPALDPNATTLAAVLFARTLAPIPIWLFVEAMVVCESID